MLCVAKEWNAYGAIDFVACLLKSKKRKREV